MRVAITEVRWVEVNREARQRLAKAEKENLCVACMQPLDHSRTVRGCHERCYRATIRGIAKGQTTEAERIEEGKLHELPDYGSRATNPVTKELSKR